MITQDYTLTFWGLFVILATLIVQSLVAALVKAKQPGAIPGKMNPELGHESFVYRSNRCLANSLENATIMLGTSVLAILVGANPKWAGICTLGFALARLGHMWLYYVIATEKNPSPRSYFYLLGLVLNIILLVQICLSLLK